jgi:tubulin beta
VWALNNMTEQKSQAGRQILMVSMGQGGNAIASAFVDKLLAECGVGPGGEPPADRALADALSVFCDQRADGRLIPRRLLAAAHSRVKSREAVFAIADSPFASLYPEEAMLLDAEEFGNHNWAEGYQAPTVWTLCEMVRARISALNGECVIWLFHSLGGSYGAGAGARFLEAINEEYGGSVPIISIALAPSPKVSDATMEPYNAILSLKRVLSYADQIILFDNEAVWDEMIRSKSSKPNDYSFLNTIISTALYTLSSPMLWPDAEGQRMSADAFHASLRNATPGADWEWPSKDAETMQASQRFVAVSNCYRPLSTDETDASLAGRLLEGRAGLVSSTDRGQWLKMFAVRLGAPGSADGFSQAIPGGHAKLAFDLRSNGRLLIAAGGHTAIAATLERLRDAFTTLYARRAFLHWYTPKGIDEIEWYEAESALENAINDIRAAAGPSEVPDETDE